MIALVMATFFLTRHFYHDPDWRAALSEANQELADQNELLKDSLQQVQALYDLLEEDKDKYRAQADSFRLALEQFPTDPQHWLDSLVGMMDEEIVELLIELTGGMGIEDMYLLPLDNIKHAVVGLLEGQECVEKLKLYKGLTNAQDSVIDRLEALNLNQGVQIDYQRRMINNQSVIIVNLRQENTRLDNQNSVLRRMLWVTAAGGFIIGILL